MKKPLTLRKIVYYECSYCHTKKLSADPFEQCPNCGAFTTTAVIREINLGKRQPFAIDERQAEPR